MCAAAQAQPGRKERAAVAVPDGLPLSGPALEIGKADIGVEFRGALAQAGLEGGAKRILAQRQAADTRLVESGAAARPDLVVAVIEPLVEERHGSGLGGAYLLGVYLFGIAPVEQRKPGAERARTVQQRRGEAEVEPVAGIAEVLALGRVGAREIHVRPYGPVIRKGHRDASGKGIFLERLASGRELHDIHGEESRLHEHGAAHVVTFGILEAETPAHRETPERTHGTGQHSGAPQRRSVALAPEGPRLVTGSERRLGIAQTVEPEGGHILPRIPQVAPLEPVVTRDLGLRTGADHNGSRKGQQPTYAVTESRFHRNPPDCR